MASQVGGDGTGAPTAAASRVDPASGEQPHEERISEPAWAHRIVAARRAQIIALARANLAVARYRATEEAVQFVRGDLRALERTLGAHDLESIEAQRNLRQTQFNYVGALADFLCGTQAADQRFCDDLYLVAQVAVMNRPVPEVLDAAARLNRFAEGLQARFEREYHQGGEAEAQATIAEARHSLGGPVHSRSRPDVVVVPMEPLVIRVGDVTMEGVGITRDQADEASA